MKIQVTSGKNSNSKKPISFDNSTTMQFGEVQPLMCMELESKSKISVKQNSIVRLGVLNCPTFGRVKYATFGRFVPIVDIYRPFENLLSQQAFSVGDSTYIPTSVPVAPLGWLSAFLLNKKYADLTVYKTTQTSVSFSSTYQMLGSTDTQNNLVYNYFIEHTGISFPAGTRSISGSIAGGDFSIIPPSAFNASYYPKQIRVSPDSADFLFYFKVGSNDSGVTEGTYAFAYRLNSDGRRLYKTFVGCGFQFDITSTDNVSILPLLAFFKAYFDLFRPLNTSTGSITYDNTPAHKLQEIIVHRNAYNVSDSDANQGEQAVNVFFSNFIDDLAVCTYFQETDYITSHISQPSLSKALRVPISGAQALQTVDGAGTSLDGKLPTLTAGVNGSISASYGTAWNVKLLLRLLPYFNKNTIVGGNIEKWLKSHGFGDFIQNSKSYSAGKFELPCTISDINSTADTFDSATGQGEALGAYAGKGIGITDEKGGQFSYSADTQGFFIILGTIIPISRFGQGVNPSIYHRSKLEFYDPAFDALDYSISRKNIIKGQRDVAVLGTLDDNNTELVGSPYSQSYGYIPRFSEYCYLPNVLNGLMSLRSYRKTFLPYTLDKYIQDENEHIKAETEIKFVISINTPSNGTNVPVSTPQLRNIGNPVNGNFDRIFADSRIYPSTFNSYILQYGTDNFIIHNQFDVSYHSGKKPLSISFETNDGGNEMSINKE